MSTTLSGSWDEEENTRQNHRQHDSQQNSQLTAPPDPNKKGKKKATPSAFRSKENKTKPFKNPVITKHLVTRVKEFPGDIPSSKFVSTYQGWATTEDAVRLNSNGIAKTTLDKLTAFRYESSARPVVSGSSTTLPTTYEVRSDLSEGHEIHLDPQETGHPSIDQDPFPSRNSPLEAPPFEPTEMQPDDGLEETKAQGSRLAHFTSDHDNFFTNAVWNVRPSNKPAPSNSQSAADLELDEPHFQQRVQVNNNIHFNQSSPQYPPDSLVISSETSASPAQPSQHVTDCFEPTSSEAKVLRYLLDTSGINQRNQQVYKRSEVENPEVQNGTTAYFEQAMEADCPDGSKLLGGSSASARELEELSSQNISYDHHHPNGPLLKLLTEVQVERSDVEDVEMVRDVSKHYESDQFDDGLDDSDLAAMVSESVAPGTQFNVESTGREKHGVLSKTQHMGFTFAPPQDRFASGNPVNLTFEIGNPDPAIETHRAPIPRILSSEPDDEYPMDEGDVEMFKMPELMTTGVIEQFQAPPSLQYAFGDEPGSGEVYDSSLQFSPPKYQYTPSSPMKVPGDLHTDKLSKGDSPTHRSNPELLPAGDEEDWNFIRSSRVVEEAEVQVIFNTFSDPQRLASTDSLERGESLFSPRPLADTIASDSAVAPTSAIQTDGVSMLWILDDSHEYQPLRTFARPNFPVLIRDRSPINGVSAQTFLRVCFRIGEMFKEGARCEALKQGAVIELFAHVTFSSREPGTTKQHFQFADLWHDRPPFANGVLANYRTTDLAESESKAFLGADEGTMARCLGRLKRDSKNGTGWMLHITTIRTTDWEEIKWTKRVVSAGLVKSETLGLSKL
jgi:hypothetical protein